MSAAVIYRFKSPSASRISMLVFIAKYLKLIINRMEFKLLIIIKII